MRMSQSPLDRPLWWARAVWVAAFGLIAGGAACSTDASVFKRGETQVNPPVTGGSAATPRGSGMAMGAPSGVSASGPSAAGAAPGTATNPMLAGAAGTNGSASGGAATPAVPKPDPISINKTGADNPAGLPAAEVDKLMAGGPLGDLKWLYPYEDTIFPRGMLAPLVMWNGDPEADALYLHIKAQLFEYKAILKPTEAEELALANLYSPLWALVFSQMGWQASGKQLLIPQEIWDQAGAMAQGTNDIVTLELSERARGKVRGLIRSHIRFAQANFKGSVYYSACTTANANAGNTGLASLSGNGKVFRIPPAGTAQLVLSNQGEDDTRCQGCHSVSADGSRLVAQRAPTPDERLSREFTTAVGLSYQLQSGGVTDVKGTNVGPNAAYGALYPDGRMFLSSAIPAVSNALSTDDPDFFISHAGLISTRGGVFAGDKLIPAALYDAATGAVTANTGIPEGAMMPTFSPDGTKLTFTDLALRNARGIAMMNYDTSSHKASSYEVLTQEEAGGQLRPGWPFFLPDNKAVVFTRTDTASFSSYYSTAPRTSTDDLPVAHSDLYILDVATGKTTLLAKAMGFASAEDATSDTTYLPFGTFDLHRNYFPTVSQVAAGGYFWVFFDTWRHYGNLGMQRGLWGFAVDIRPGGYVADPSHPPFYLPGQEFGNGVNHRAFVALDPCKKQGESCTSAIDCCDGTTCAFESTATATSHHGLPVGTCAPPAPPPAPPPGMPMCTTCATCAQLDERCTVTADCCDPSYYCINGRCAFADLQ